MEILQSVVFLLGVLVMAFAGMAYGFRWLSDSLAAWIFRLGLLLAVGSHGWPERLG